MMYGVKTVSKPPTNAHKRSTHTHTNPQMHARDPHTNTVIHKCMR